GNSMIVESFGVGVTASLTQVWPVLLPMNASFGLGNTSYPDPTTLQKFYGGAATIAGATGVNAPINGSYTLFRIYFNSVWRGYKSPFFSADPQANIVLLTKSSG